MSLLIGQKAPDFTAPAVMGDNVINDHFNLKKYLDGKMGVLFFYPLDFTFVCPSEIISFDKRVPLFHEKGAKVIGVSVDSHFTHLAWKKTALAEGGIGNVKFPLVADLTKSIAQNYHVLMDGSVALRGTFLIDKNFKIRHCVLNDLPLGRNVDEALRMVDALNHVEEYGEVCPAGWMQGDSAMQPTSEGVATYLKQFGDKL